MLKSLLSIAGVLTAGALTFSATASDLSGYFRVSNAKSGLYVDVRGPFTAEPDREFQAASTLPGTVLYIDADWVKKDGEALFRVNSLRGQGIEIVGEPIDDYLGKLEEIILTPDGFESSNEALWALVRGGFENGYTSIGRALVQTMIFIVAQRLDEEPNISDKEKNELANFAKRFNDEVAGKIDLHIYMQKDPTSEKFRLLFDTPNLNDVSAWYLNEQNKATFEKGFAAMRQYLNAKMGNTGEGIDPNEVAEMKGWGYEIPEKYFTECGTNADGVLLLTYEKIFADPDLLFNWLKLNVIKFTDPERCPQIELQGLWLPNFAIEMQKHALTAQLISYFPRLQTDQRVYLTDGKYGTFGHLDFTSQTGAFDLGEASQFVLTPVTDEDGEYLCFAPQGYDKEGWYASVYTDFPMKAVNPETTKFYLLSEDTQTKDIKYPDNSVFSQFNATYEYHTLIEVEQVDRKTPVLVEMTTDNPAEHRILPVYTLEWNMTPQFGFGVSDEIVSEQRAPRRAVETDSDNSTEDFKGILLGCTVNADELRNRAGFEYDAKDNPLHTLTTKLTSVNTGYQPVLWYQVAKENSQLAPNTAFLPKPNCEEATYNGFGVKEPTDALFDDKTTGVENITVETPADGRLYNLQGVEVFEPVPGNIYILNGKKIIIK